MEIKSDKNITYNISESWLELKEIESRKENGLNVYVYECHINANESSSERKAEITFTVENTKYSKSITIKQNCYMIDISQDVFELDSRDQILNLVFSCYSECKTLITEDWVRLLQHGKTGAYNENGDLYKNVLYIKKNESSKERTTIITIKSDELGISKQITIKQKGAPTGNEDGKHVEGAGGINDMKEHNR